MRHVYRFDKGKLINVPREAQPDELKYMVVNENLFMKDLKSTGLNLHRHTASCMQEKSGQSFKNSNNGRMFDNMQESTKNTIKHRPGCKNDTKTTITHLTNSPKSSKPIRQKQYRSKSQDQEDRLIKIRTKTNLITSNNSDQTDPILSKQRSIEFKEELNRSRNKVKQMSQTSSKQIVIEKCIKDLKNSVQEQQERKNSSGRRLAQSSKKDFKEIRRRRYLSARQPSSNNNNNLDDRAFLSQKDELLIERKKKVEAREDQRLLRKLRKKKREELRSDFLVHSKVYCKILRKSKTLTKAKRYGLSYKNYIDGVSGWFDHGFK